MSYEEYRVANVDEAIALASSFKDQRKYNWFRGQTKPWPPYSSAFRIKFKRSQNWAEVIEAPLLRFLKWIQLTPGMESFTNDVNGTFAVAQHYGLPTDYIDFTTDPAVAGFFACDTKHPEFGSDSCIYCLDTQDLASLWDMISEAVRESSGERIPPLEFIESTVPNLWRLEAQRGVFLYCITNWDIHYPMDRILFPYSGYPASPTREDIYPRRKSYLEILLDQYFMNEALLVGNKELYEWYKSLRAPNKSWFKLTQHPNNTNAEFFHGGSVPSLPSWSAEQLKSWLAIRTETMEQAEGPTIRLAIDSEHVGPDQQQVLVNAFMRLLHDRPVLRTKNVTWVLSDPRSSAYVPDPVLLNALDWIWDGMRSLPYTNPQVAEAMATCFILYQSDFRVETPVSKATLIVQEVVGREVMRLEFGTFDGSYSKGYAAVSDLKAALRSDMKDLLLPQYVQEFCADLHKLLQIIHAPDRTFEFEPLANIFAGQLIPTQALLRGGKAAFFSPARLNSLGLP